MHFTYTDVFYTFKHDMKFLSVLIFIYKEQHFFILMVILLCLCFANGFVCVILCNVQRCVFFSSPIMHCLHHVDFLKIVQSWISTNGLQWNMKMWTGDIHQHDNNMDILKRNFSKNPADVKEDVDSVTKEVTVIKLL